MCAPSPPPAPDYGAAAKAQGEANVEAARVQGRMANPNVFNPYGTQTVTWGEGAPVFDQAGYDKALQAYNNTSGSWQSVSQPGENELRFVPGTPTGPAPTREQFTTTPQSDQPTITQKFSPEQQQLYDTSNQVKGLLGGLGVQGATALQSILGRNLDLAGAPQVGSYEETRKKVIDAMMGRADEDYGQATDQANSELIAAGIRPGNKAYADRMQMIERSRNDARTQAELAGGNAASQAYGMDSDRRRTAIAELLSQRQTPLNEVTALMSGSQVSNPFAVPGFNGNQRVEPAPIFPAAVAQGNYNMQANQGGSGFMNGLFGLGAAGLMAPAGTFTGPTGLLATLSDRRLKSNVKRVGTHPLGIGIYEYEILGRRERGVMADEVERVKPEAVLTHPSGFKMVTYALID